MDSWRYCGMDGRAWTDVLTNASSIAPHEDKDDPRPWLTPVAIEASHIAAFLHEVTHHWCFHSLVGTATLAVAARAAVTATTLLVMRDSSISGPPAELDLLGDGLRSIWDLPEPAEL